MTQLSRLAKVGIAKESTPNTYIVPAYSVPFTKCDYEDVTAPLRDESVRANDAVLQGLYPGPKNTTIDFEMWTYTDITGLWLRGVIGPDTVTAGVSTTLASNATLGATSLSLTASVPNNSMIQISDAGGTNTEWVQVGTVSGAGPYTAPVTSPATGTKYAHTAAGGSVLSQSTHTFKQNRTSSTVWPTYSITINDLTDVIGYVGCVISEVAIKIDPKAIVSIAPKLIGMPSGTQADFVYAASAAQPQLGWQWTMTNAGASSTRGLTFDTTVKRAVEPIWSSDGTQNPREIFAGALECDSTYKAIFENDTDLALFTSYSQQPVTATVTQPAVMGGMSLALTMSQSGWIKAKKDLSQPYVQAQFDISAINNTTDSGIMQAVLKNFVQTAY